MLFAGVAYEIGCVVRKKTFIYAESEKNCAQTRDVPELIFKVPAVTGIIGMKKKISARTGILPLTNVTGV